MFGYALAFGEGSQFIGYTHFGLIGLPFEDFAFLFFQVIFVWNVGCVGKLMQ